MKGGKAMSVEDELGPCVVCNLKAENRAHVRDESDCKLNGIPDQVDNIIELCRYCHYEIFDKGYMVIIYIISGHHEFLYYEPRYEIIEHAVSSYPISLAKDHVDWKNLRAVTELQVRL